jgi:hypothetical protein
VVFDATAKPDDCGDGVSASESSDSGRSRAAQAPSSVLNPVLVKPVHGRSDSGAHREGAYPNHKPEAVNSGKEGTDALKNRKKEAGPNDRALSAVIPGGRQLRRRSFESRWLRENG